MEAVAMQFYLMHTKIVMNIIALDVWSSGVRISESLLLQQ